MKIRDGAEIFIKGTEETGEEENVEKVNVHKTIWIKAGSQIWISRRKNVKYVPTDDFLLVTVLYIAHNSLTNTHKLAAIQNIDFVINGCNGQPSHQSLTNEYLRSVYSWRWGVQLHRDEPERKSPVSVYQKRDWQEEGKIRSAMVTCEENECVDKDEGKRKTMKKRVVPFLCWWGKDSEVYYKWDGRKGRYEVRWWCVRKMSAWIEMKGRGRRWRDVLYRSCVGEWKTVKCITSETGGRECMKCYGEVWGERACG